MSPKTSLALGACALTLATAPIIGMLPARSASEGRPLPYALSGLIQITPVELDLGELQPLSPGTGTITIRNGSVRAITARRLMASCACIETDLSDGEPIASGEERSVQVTMTASTIVGRTRTKKLVLEIDGIGRQEIEVSCTAVEVITVRPKRVVIRDQKPVAIELCATDDVAFEVRAENPAVHTTPGHARTTHVIEVEPGESLPSRIELSLTHPRASRIVLEVVDQRQ